MATKIIQGDCLEVMRAMPSGSVDCCVTSPPYWGLRDYGCDGQLGLESTPEAYVAKMVEVFREVRRLLKDSGTCWVNLGDSYANSLSKSGSKNGGLDKYAQQKRGQKDNGPKQKQVVHGTICKKSGMQSKSLVGIPWRVAFALQSDGWILRQDIIWHKPNPMPESVRDRCTKTHEYLFLLVKQGRYWWDKKAMGESSKYPNDNRKSRQRQNDYDSQLSSVGQLRAVINPKNARTYPTRNRRSVWTITPKPYKGAHFAVMPEDLVEPCIRAGCPPEGVVLDPFGGSGTVGLVANKLGRNAILCELNPSYCDLAEQRLAAELLPLESVTP